VLPNPITVPAAGGTLTNSPVAVTGFWCQPWQSRAHVVVGAYQDRYTGADLVAARKLCSLRTTWRALSRSLAILPGSL